MIAKQERLLELCKEVLQEDYLYLDPLRYDVTGAFEPCDSRVRCTIRERGSSEEIAIAGEAVGGITAFFQALKDHYAEEHASLNTIAVHDFLVRARKDSGESPDGADAAADVVIEIRNSYGKLFRFEDTSRNVIRSSLRATLAAVEYFINSERAVTRLHNAIEHARREGRSDTVAQYTRNMADLVENTSYTEVIERIRAEHVS